MFCLNCGRKCKENLSGLCDFCEGDAQGIIKDGNIEVIA